ncbi:MAG: SH3 domain-containing protein [Gallionellaceae bacterium]
MKIVKTGAAALLWMLMSSAMAGEAGVALKADDIRAEPFGDAKSVGTLAANDKVDIVGKNGGWLQVKSAKGKGWVRMLSIRKGDAKKGANETAGLLSMASGRSGTGKVVATTGIRGLNEEELKAAKYNEEEVKLLESHSTSKEQAQQFANDGKLVARKFDYLPEVK